MSGVLLRADCITKEFPGVKALDNVSFELERGEVHALLGENGAGKSTLIKVMGGIYNSDSGRIIIDGEEIHINTVKEAKEAGIAIIHQELVLVPHMTVAENIFMGREPSTKGIVDYKRMTQEAQKLLEEFDVPIRANAKVKSLTIAQQQMVEIIKAISYRSRILVMDEPTSSISEKEVDFLFKVMRRLTMEGVGIIYISHKMSELSEICDRVTILRDGQSVTTKVVKDTTNDELIALMVGRELNNYYIRDHIMGDEVVLSCNNISDGNMVKDVSIKVNKGEIVGLAGLVGAGRSEAMKCIFGLTKNYSGSIEIKGKLVAINKPKDAMKSGVALVPENRKEEGLYSTCGVDFNTSIEVLRTFIKGIYVNKKKEKELTQRYIDMMNTKTPTHRQTIGKLSGGNQQKVLISRWLATDPDILILDEPTRGVDVGAKAEIYEIMNNLTKSGLSIIMISSELPEIINMSDRVYIFRDGVVTGELNYQEVSQSNIMALAAR